MRLISRVSREKVLEVAPTDEDQRKLAMRLGVKESSVRWFVSKAIFDETNSRDLKTIEKFAGSSRELRNQVMGIKKKRKKLFGCLPLPR